MNLYLDLECVPHLDAEAIAEIEAGIKAPGNYSKQETIDKWMDENKTRLIEEKVHASCFDAATGKIICIGWAWNDEAVNVFHGEEREIIATLFDDIKNASKGMFVTVTGHNVGWDVRYVWQRAIIHNLKPAANVKWQGKPWDHQDTMTMWNPDRERRISLAKLCKVLGVPTSKSHMDGSKVWAAWKEGRIEEIAEYCRGDVEATRACYRRMVS